jgi:LysM repeat protein
VLITIIQQNGVSVKNKFAQISGMHNVKHIIAVVVLVFCVQIISAQNNYIKHTLKQGETLSMLAKQYHTTVGDIMRVNGMHADSKLVYGSKINIPSTKAQVKETKKEPVTVAQIEPASANAIVHTVAKGETLFSISKQYNTTVEQIKRWNNLGDNSAKIGTALIVGGNAVTATTQKQSAGATTAAEEKNETVINTDPPVTAVYETKNISTQPVSQTNNNTNASTQIATLAYSGDGFFASQFQDKKARNMKKISGVSKIFKTASGWSDGKYYILANEIEPGTIVKLTADNGNSVYAKVLWNMGDLKENAGINFRVSNATAAALHVNDASSFNVSVSF